ncbi:phosphoenolpyruvate carboxylase [Lactobacillus delbrueckii]|nr:phosphoenolpyruvate carboxylase [Lactobacillus delbrueckii]ALT46563.1 hypothetical protein AT236_00137 [Lactobacillus delbrueckii subsp. bulgaricus]MCD5463215.1 phosphoenolpyruvate carboxylase [Lactobacillus delbrueckii subsp. bulgaricus]MCD5473722.1 phosphoenolpyruvate carboxylase [Lactobacillus delbrueckii subsp. bulgaricus]
MMKNFATKPAVKIVFLLAGICLALFMAVQWIFAWATQVRFHGRLPA